MKFRNLLFPMCVAGVAFLASSCSEKKGDVVYDNIMTRTSVRAYTNEPIDAAVVSKLVKAGMAAPSARNQQPWHFVVVDNKDIMKQLAETGASMAAEAPLAIVVCGNMQNTLDGVGKDYWIQDGSAAIENILLAAHAFGLGAVWTGGYPNVERANKVANVLHLPEYIKPLGMIVIGHPAENPNPKDKYTEAKVSYNLFDGAAVAANTPAEVTDAELPGFKKVDVRSQWKENPFTFFDGDGLLLAAGKEGAMNAMTIGWGQMGALWGMQRPVVTVYVRDSRYTDKFMKDSEYFTVSGFTNKYSDALRYMGTKSGRDGDKVKATGLNVTFSKLGNPLFSDARVVLECKKLYQAPLNPDGFGEVAKDVYAKDPSLHNVYVGEVVNAWVK
ncbi:MAG: nitroreductase family protein [Paludibacteraceae bacterium]|nr:nitroreductase family protein [Paludibacteraceae bacterium]